MTQTATHILLHVVASSISLVSATNGRKFAHFAAPPFPTEPAWPRPPSLGLRQFTLSLGFGGSAIWSSQAPLKPAQIRPHSPGRCLFPLLLEKSHTAAYRAKQGGSCVPCPVRSFRGDDLVAGLFLVTLRLVHTLPHHLLRGFPLMHCGLLREAQAAAGCSSGCSPEATCRFSHTARS